MLPADLRAAEAQALDALRSALAGDANGRWSVEWRFEGLRVLPVALRLAQALIDGGQELKLLFPDAGAAALARRDGGELAERIQDFGVLLRLPEGSQSEGLMLAVAPSPADYVEFEQICGNHRGPMVMLNGRLEDAAVGIGSVARERRRGFLSQWQVAYAVQPVDGGALRRAHPGPWELYREDSDGFRFTAEFEQKPDGERQAAALAGEGGVGLGGNLKALDAFIEGLRN